MAKKKSRKGLVAAILSKKLDDLACFSVNPNNLKNAVKFLLQDDKNFYAKKVTDETAAELSFEFTVGDVVKAYNRKVAWSWASSWLQDFRDEVIKLGLTQLDWIALSAETVTEEMFKNVSKKELKKLSILLLGTVKKALFKALSEKLKKNTLEEISIGDLLDISTDNWGKGRDNLFWEYVVATQDKLLAIGFSEEDGAFLRGKTSEIFRKGTLRRKSKKAA